MSLFTRIDGHKERATLSVRWAEDACGPVERRRGPRDHLCFGISGSTRIACARGLVPAVELKVGDQVANGQGGFNRIEAVLVALTAPGRERIMIARGALGNGLPAREMVVGPRQRLRVSGSIVNDLSNHECATVAAEDLCGMTGVETVVGKLSEVVHIVIDTYDFVVAEGLVLEGLAPTRTVLDTLPLDLTEELCGAMPKLRYATADAAYIPTVPALDKREAACASSREVCFGADIADLDWSDQRGEDKTAVARLIFKDGRGPAPVLSLAAKNV